MPKYSLGPYRKIYYCESCRWYKHPDSMFFMPDCCPKCGADIEPVIGRYKIKTTKGFFRFKTEIIGFEPIKIMKRGTA